MNINSLIHALSDAIQQHEGWIAEGGKAWPNLNPGNLHMEGQAGASGEIGAEAIFGSFYDGKQALNNDINAKVQRGYNTITKLITLYESGDASNDVPAYIAEVVAFLAARNITIGADDDFGTFLTNFQKDEILVAVNGIYAPADWASIQASIVLVAQKMPNYCFTCRYSNVDLSGSVGTSTGNPMGTPYSVIEGKATFNALLPYWQGQTANVLIYNGSVMVGHPTPAGGCEYQYTLTKNPEQVTVAAYASVIYEGPTFTDSTARDIFHELIHELFTVTEQPDVLHADLVKGEGYTANAWTDLEGCFTGNQLNTPVAVENLEKEKAAI